VAVVVLVVAVVMKVAAVAAKVTVRCFLVLLMLQVPKWFFFCTRGPSGVEFVMCRTFSASCVEFVCALSSFCASGIDVFDVFLHGFGASGIDDLFVIFCIAGVPPKCSAVVICHNIKYTN
jgi:hypothetical protein